MLGRCALSRRLIAPILKSEIISECRYRWLGLLDLNLMLSGANN